MNRHLIYSALPADALGPPMRAEPEKPADGPWKHLRPGYEVRTLAGGAQEVRCTALPVQPAKQPGTESVMHGLAEPSAAPIEWHETPPAECGWFNVQDDQDRKYRYTTVARHWDGSRWSGYVCEDDTRLERLGAAAIEAYPSDYSGQGHNIRWRGPRLVGADWPEPEQQA